VQRHLLCQAASTIVYCCCCTMLMQDTTVMCATTSPVSTSVHNCLLLLQHARCSMQDATVMCATTSSVSSSVHNRLLLLLHHAHAGHHSDVCNNIFCVKQRPQLSTAAAPCSMHDATVMCATTSSVSSSVHNRLLLLHHAQCRTPQ